METNCLIFWGIFLICLSTIVSICIMYRSTYRIKKMELKHKKELEELRTKEKQKDEKNEVLIQEIKSQVLNNIEKEVKEVIDKKFSDTLTERVERLEKQVKSKT